MIYIHYTLCRILLYEQSYARQKNFIKSVRIAEYDTNAQRHTPPIALINNTSPPKNPHQQHTNRHL